MAITIGHMIIGALLVALVSLSLNSFANDVAEDFDDSIDLSTLDKSVQIREEVDEIRNVSSSKLVNIPVVGDIIIGVKGSIEFLDFVGETVTGTWDSLLHGFAELFGIEDEYVKIFEAIILTVIVLTIAGAIIKWVLL